tara:strand:- start:111 stop:431 length:321 start_codon:yes stop_codon:yes gene_type:complete
MERKKLRENSPPKIGKKGEKKLPEKKNWKKIKIKINAFSTIFFSLFFHYFFPTFFLDFSVYFSSGAVGNYTFLYSFQLYLTRVSSYNFLVVFKLGCSEYGRERDKR